MIPRNIIIHHSLTKDTTTVSWQAIRRYHTKALKWDDIGYHFGIELINHDYEILIGRMPNQSGAHCKDQGMNHKSLGVCFVGNFDHKKPDQEQWQKGVELCASICEILSLGVDKIKGHRDFATRKTCPGKMFDMGQFRTDVLLGLNCAKKT